MKVNDITARMNIDPGRKKHILEVATGRRKADLVLKNATWVNVFCNDLGHGDIAVAEGCIAGIGGEYHGETEIDVSGRIVLPGFIDAGTLIGVESCVSSPIRFRRDMETGASSMPGLYLAGEGCGAAGGIISAACDGLRLFCL